VGSEEEPGEEAVAGVPMGVSRPGLCAHVWDAVVPRPSMRQRHPHRPHRPSIPAVNKPEGTAIQHRHIDADSALRPGLRHRTPCFDNHGVHLRRDGQSLE